jgi:hypothetical protein
VGSGAVVVEQALRKTTPAANIQAQTADNLA